MFSQKIHSNDHELVTYPNGSVSVLDTRVNQGMHSYVGPEAEAREVYLAQSGLKELLSETGDPIIVYDVGLGTAANALATLDFFLKADPKRGLTLVSFESDVRGLSLALDNLSLFPDLSRYESLVRLFLRDGRAVCTHENQSVLEWVLCKGDFRDQLVFQAPPHLIFFDLFSPQVCPELWGIQTFQLLYDKTEDLRRVGVSTRLITYCTATSVRASMLYSGFHVGQGRGTHYKKETTVAATLKPSLERPLSAEWVEKWKKSSKPLPCDSALAVFPEGANWEGLLIERVSKRHQ